MYSWRLNVINSIKSLMGDHKIELKLVTSDEINYRYDEDHNFNFVKIYFDDTIVVYIYDRKENNIIYDIHYSDNFDLKKHKTLVNFLCFNEEQLYKIYNSIFNNDETCES